MGSTDLLDLMVSLNFLITVLTSEYISADFPAIRPVPCVNDVTNETGLCMFNWSCRYIAKGSHIGHCVDRFLVGICCKVPEERLTAQSVLTMNQSQHANERQKISAAVTLYEIITSDHKKQSLKQATSSIYHQQVEHVESKVQIGDRKNFTAVTSQSSVNALSFDSSRPFYKPILTTGPSSHENQTRSSTRFFDFLFSREPAIPTPQPAVFHSDIAASVVDSVDTTHGSFDINATLGKWTEPIYPWPNRLTTTTSSENLNAGSLIKGNSRICGRSQSVHQGRIVGGTKSEYLKWPWMISLRRFEGRLFKHKCGATLLSRLWAITAAHCVDGKMPNDLLLRLGEYNFHQANESLPHVERRVYLMIIHPGFDPVTYENDLALLRFYEPVSLRSNIIPVCLPQSHDDAAGRMAVVMGWGRLTEDGELPGSLHEVHMPILTNKECERMYSGAGYVETIPDVFICAGVLRGGLDACEGDSGGPMVVKNDVGQWTLIGLISWGMGCAAPSQPGVYTRVTTFVEWIQQIITF